MAKFLTDKTYAVQGKLVAIDATGMIGPFFTLRVPAKGYDLRRPASYLDLTLLDPTERVYKNKIHINDELTVIVHPATAHLESGTADELTFQIHKRQEAQFVSHAVRRDTGQAPINGKIIDNDEYHMVVVDAGLPMVVNLLDHKPSQTREIGIGKWVTFWPVPPTQGLIL